MIRPILTLSVLCAASLVPQYAAAQFAFGGDAPIAVNAKTATYKGGLTVLEGNVDVRQSGARIQSDTMDIIRAEVQPNERGSVALGDVTKIVAVGNFKYTSDENSVTGDRGVYERDKGIITVTGNVIFKTNNGATVNGKKLVYNVKNNTAKFGDKCVGNNCKAGRVTFSSNK